MHEAIGLDSRHSRKDAELFVYLRLTTLGQLPLLADEDVAQAVKTALSAQARMQRCHVLAAGSDEYCLHLVVQFPVSLSPKDIVSIIREASAFVLAQVAPIKRERRHLPDDVWEGPYRMDTLSRGDVPAAIAYVCHHIGLAPTEQLAWHDFLREAASAYGNESRP